MNLKNKTIPVIFAALAVIFLIQAPQVYAVSGKLHADKRQVIEHWTPERKAAAIPRDLMIDQRGLGYLRKSNGSLEPYGHSTAHNDQSGPVARGKPSGGSADSTPPSISAMDPAEGAVIGASQVFSALVTDSSGIRSVAFVVTYPDGVTTQSFSANYEGSDRYEVLLQGFSDGIWSWHVEAKDGGPKGGNSGTSDSVSFTVDSGGSSGGGGSGGNTGGDYITVDAPWTDGGAVQTAAGRIYFEMPANAKRKGPWNGYVCSGTVVNDEGTVGRSLIITAAHCVYDDANGAFARNVLFIPNQDGTSADRTDTNCDNDPLGCWAPTFGVVDVNWTENVFPANIKWDYAYYVVEDSGAHSGNTTTSEILDLAAGSLDVDFQEPAVDDGEASATSPDFTHALGYSYSDDPNFMFCAEDMTTEGAVNWWLPNCGLSGGSSGGPWVQPMDVASGDGPIISVNSWGYTTAPGMAGPILRGTSAACIYEEAKAIVFDSVPSRDGDAGVAIDYCL